MAREWSKQQKEIFNWFANGQNHLVARARAGTGKTTVVVEGVKLAPERSILICAFSKIIQEELESRFTTVDENGNKTRTHHHIEAKTLHSVGYACVRRFRERINVKFNSDRADALAMAVCGNRAPDAVVRLVSKLHTKGREIAPHAKNFGDLTNIAIEFDCLPESDWEQSGFGAEYVEMRALEAMELASKCQNGTIIDGSDMIFLPVRNGWMTPMYDLVVVDEAQDMTTAQLEIARGVLRPGGRIAVVGDDRQAIFGFRGADSGSLDRLKSELNADELGLTVTYRCGRVIVGLAQDLVPDFAAGPNNPDGCINEIERLQLPEMAGPGDFILSRVNAPLVSIAMQLLRRGKRTRIAGRDIGKGLVGLVRKFKATSVPDFLRRVEAWRMKEESRIMAAMEKAVNGRKKAFESKIEAINDQADMLISLSDGARNIQEVTDRIEALFTDDGLGVAGMITCSSVHRAKGLEANRVFILRNTLRYNNVEEENIAYVAITRAKQTLVWVDDSREE